MKIAVIFGVSQMVLGTCMKGFNSIYFRRYFVLVFEVFTQLVLILCLFGFMDLLIIQKWLTDWTNVPKDKIAPGIIQTMIVMFIQQGDKTKFDKDADIILDQASTMKVLLVCALVSVPLMLFMVPCLNSKSSKAHCDDDFVEMRPAKEQEYIDLARGIT